MSFSTAKVMQSFTCKGHLNPVTSAGHTSEDIGASANMELVYKFCYLDDMLSVGSSVLTADLLINKDNQHYLCSILVFGSVR